jgi:hypothetical protein
VVEFFNLSIGMLYGNRKVGPVLSDFSRKDVPGFDRKEFARYQVSAIEELKKQGQI